MLIDRHAIAGLFSGQSLYDILLITAILMFLNSSVMVPPSEYICIGAGVSACINGHSVFGIVVVAALANFLGTSIYYYWGRRRFLKYGLSSSNTKTASISARFFHSPWDAVLATFARLGWVGVFVSRFIPLARSIASYPAGRAGVPPIVFCLASILGIVVWCLTWIVVGYAVGAVDPGYVLPLVAVISIAVVILAKPIARAFLHREVEDRDDG